MGAPVRQTVLGQMWDEHCAALRLALKGTPLLDAEGHPVFVDGKLVMIPPSAAHLREARELMKQCGIDEEPIDGSSIMQVAKQIEQYEEVENFQIPDKSST